MTLIPGCRLLLHGHPVYGWWSLDPGMDGYYLRRMWVGPALEVAVALYGVEWPTECGVQLSRMVRRRVPVPSPPEGTG